MTSPQILPEIWDLVIQYLRQPLPPPTGKAKRCEIRQPDLAACMRVSHLFYDLTGPLLYSIIAADHLPSLTSRLWGTPPAPGLKSKLELLSRCKRLYLEYVDRSEPSYLTLMMLGSPFFSLLHPSTADIVRVNAAEVDWITSGTTILEGTSKNLISISTGAMLGDQTGIWQRVWEDPAAGYPNRGKLAVPLGKARSQIASLAAAGQGRAVLCQHVGFEPLVNTFAIGSEGCPPDRLRNRRHLNTVACSDITSVSGGVSRWYASFGGDMGDDEMYYARHLLAQQVAKHVERRHKGLKGLRRSTGRAPTATDLSVDIYAPPAFQLGLDWSVQTMAFREAVLGAMAANGSPAAWAKRAEWRIKPLAEAPPCEACGWCVDDL